MRTSLSANELKIAACISMFMDHLGMIIFPDVLLYRYIGRLAFPIFAFFIAEGVIHTSDKLKYFLRVAVLGLICQAAYVIYAVYILRDFSELYLNVLITLALGILVCYAWQLAIKKKIYFILFLALVLAVAAFNLLCSISSGAFAEGTEYLITSAYGGRFVISLDYGFVGVMLPWCCMVVSKKYDGPEDETESRAKLYRFGMMAAGLLMLSIQLLDTMNFQCLSLLALPLLWLYDGRRGSRHLKYFFYIFYPAHLTFIYLISLLL